jgi:hypothetical protein
MAQRVLRRRKRTLLTNRSTPLLPVTLRTLPSPKLDVRVRYSPGVSERKIDRAAWAALLVPLILSEAGGNKSKFCRTIGVSTRTLDRWLDMQVDVSEQSVRDVARALNRSAAEFLVRIGYYRHAELNPPATGPEEHDELIDLVLADERLSERDKVEIIEVLMERREHARQQLLRDAHWLINHRRPTDNGEAS